MNILFIIGKYPNYGGTEKVTTILANRFVENGHGVTIASFEQPKPELADVLRESILLVKLIMPVNSSQNVKVLKDIINKRGVDVILNQWCLPFYVTRLINKCRRGTKAKLISVLHGVPDRSKKVILAEDSVKAVRNTTIKWLYMLKLGAIHYVIKKSELYVYKHSDKYVVLSDSFKKNFQEYVGLKDTPKLVAIANPITIETDYETDYINNKRKQILFVGRLDLENKRVNRIIETWQLLYEDFPDWNLCLVGDGPHRPVLEEMVKDRHIERVKFTGFIKEDPIAYYRESSILMLTSDLEGFGLVVVEGMSYGVVPVVYGSYSSIYDIIEDGKQGYITSIPFSKEKTVECLLRLMMDRIHREQMAKNAIERSKLFSVDSIVKGWESLLQE